MILLIMLKALRLEKSEGANSSLVFGIKPTKRRDGRRLFHGQPGASSVCRKLANPWHSFLLPTPPKLTDFTYRIQVILGPVWQ